MNKSRIIVMLFYQYFKYFGKAVVKTLIEPLDKSEQKNIWMYDPILLSDKYSSVVLQID